MLMRKAFETMKRYRVANRFASLYPQMPQRFLMSLDYADIKHVNVGSYIDQLAGKDIIKDQRCSMWY